MSSTTINEELTQVIAFTVTPSTSFTNPKPVKRSLRIFDNQPGWTHIHWGRDFNNLNNVHIYVTWTNSQQARDFAASPSLAMAFRGVAVSTVSTIFVNLQGSLSHLQPTEAVTFYFATASMTQENKHLFETQIREATVQMQRPNGQEIHTVSIAQGWSAGTILRSGEEASAYAVLIAWSSLDALHAVKKDAESMFNNIFVPLKEAATLGTDTALYTSLGLKNKGVSGCVVS